MNVLIVEDEPPAARLLVDLLARVAADATVVGQLASVAELTRWLADHPAPDLILADIELQDGRVFDAFETSGAVAPIIFTTAYDRFVLDAFRTQGIAYLVKPVHERDLAAALTKYEELRRMFVAARPMPRLPPRDPSGFRRHFTVTAARKIRVVPLERVALIRLALSGVHVIELDGSEHAVTGNASLAEIEDSLPPAQYFRINRNEIVRLDAIAHLDPQKDRIQLAVHGTATPVTVSVHRTAAFRRWIGL